MKYPRTYHLPFSPGASDEDKIMQDISELLKIPVTITSKLDGSNVCLMRDGCFARSHAGPPKHPSFDMFKQFHAQVKYLLPSNVQFFGEWLYAVHSIKYNNLPSYFLLFGIRNTKNNTWCSWNGVENVARVTGLYTVPVITTDKIFSTEKELRKFIKKYISIPSEYCNQNEGFVIRREESFDDTMFSKYVAKWVRKGHNQIDKHWMFKQIVRNKLA